MQSAGSCWRSGTGEARDAGPRLAQGDVAGFDAGKHAVRCADEEGAVVVDIVGNAFD